MLDSTGKFELEDGPFRIGVGGDEAIAGRDEDTTTPKLEMLELLRTEGVLDIGGSEAVEVELIARFVEERPALDKGCKVNISLEAEVMTDDPASFGTPLMFAKRLLERTVLPGCAMVAD